jgi:hypothetical protein
MSKARRVTLFSKTFAERGKAEPCDKPEPHKVDGLLWPCSQPHTWLCTGVRVRREGLNRDMFEVRFTLRHRVETWKRAAPAAPYPERDFFEMLDWVERSNDAQ